MPCLYNWALLREMLPISCTVTAVGFVLLPCLMLQYSRCLGVLGLFLGEDWVTFPRFLSSLSNSLGQLTDTVIWTEGSNWSFVR